MDLGVGEVVTTLAVAGGGSAPGLQMPSVGVAISGDALRHIFAVRQFRSWPECEMDDDSGSPHRRSG